MPTNAEWDKLYNLIASDSGNSGLDSYGFKALLGGIYYEKSSFRRGYSFYDNGGYWWSASKSNDSAYARSIYLESKEANVWKKESKEFRSVRCVRD